MKVLSILLVFSFFVSCASKVEKEERRQNAFDLSGNYTTSLKQGSDINMNIDIYNENGRHDIYAKIERSSISTKDNKLLSKHGILPSVVENEFFPVMFLGRNSDRYYKVIHLDGGENISDDLGESSNTIPKN